MNTTDLLEQLLRGGQASQTGNTHAGASSGLGGLGGVLGGLLGGGSNANAGAGSAGGGLGGLLDGGLGNILGSVLGGNRGGSAAQAGGKYAALASLGMMAFQAYQSWQRQHPAAPQQAMSTIDTLQGPAAEAHSHAILRALIAAAKADGKIDEREHRMISTEIGKHTDDPQLQQWLDAEVGKPLDAAEVAGAATEPGIAAEMYLASVLLVDDQQPAERAYLHQLAAALHLDPQLQAELEQQAKGQVA